MPGDIEEKKQGTVFTLLFVFTRVNKKKGKKSFFPNRNRCEVLLNQIFKKVRK